MLSCSLLFVLAFVCSSCIGILYRYSSVLQHPPKWPVLDAITPVGADPLPPPLHHPRRQLQRWRRRASGPSDLAEVESPERSNLRRQNLRRSNVLRLDDGFSVRKCGSSATRSSSRSEHPTYKVSGGGGGGGGVTRDALGQKRALLKCRSWPFPLPSKSADERIQTVSRKQL